MWDPREKLFLQLCLFTIYLTLTESAYLSKIPARRAFEKETNFVLPKDSLTKGKNLLASVKIPNSEFCSEMILKPEDHYLVLPWWFNYCQDLRKKNAGTIRGYVDYESVNKYILAEVEQFRKRSNQKTIALTDMEKELLALNNVQF